MTSRFCFSRRAWELLEEFILTLNPNLQILETERLILRPFTTDDAPFVYELVNEPAWIRFIGDRGVRSLQDARTYLTNGPIAMYARLGFGLYMVELKQDHTPLGMCGVLKRDGLDDADIGFAFLPRYGGKGYAYEAAAATLAYAKDTLGFKRVLAITSLDNERSIKLLQKLGMTLEQTITLPNDTEELNLFAINLT